MYQVLYRKYRPKVFSDVVGQEHITTTLKTEIEKNHLSHAYLFTGSRGTGKTTCAKILSKAVNCLHPVNGDPCNECEICRGIENGSILDVVEIDAASNNGVDNIRDIRDESNFAPTACKYRVYIIDEVHMLSIGAFNALLKTLEEPPEHVKFILATTEVHKLPVTILSRCQRFDFHRVSAESMKLRMDYIASCENFTIDEEATKLIARLSDGGMRDALSMLDRCIGKSSVVDVDVVSCVAGLTGKTHLFSLAEAIAKNDVATGLNIINELHNGSFDMERLCTELIAHFRSLMIVKTVKQSENVLVCTAEELGDYKEQAKLFTLENILYCAELLQSALANIKQGVNRRTELEMAIIKLSTPSLGQDMSAVLKRLADVERAVKGGAVARLQTSAPSVQSEVKSDEKITQPAQKPQPVQNSNQSNEGEIPDRPFYEWQSVIDEIRSQNPLLAANLGGTLAEIKSGHILIKAQDPSVLKMMLAKVTREILIASHNVTGLPIRHIAVARLSDGEDVSTATENATQQSSSLDKMLESAKNLGIEIEIK